ncbi:MAG: metal-sensitive transcriptional regulator [Planctomycetota bacterium]
MAANPDHSDVLSALRRVEGQVRGVQRMVEDKKYCIDILNQIAAVKGALGSVEKRILERHFQHCVKNAMTSQSEAETSEKIREIIDLVNKRIS